MKRSLNFYFATYKTCNLNCRYCYIPKKENLTDGETDPKTLAALDTLIEKFDGEGYTIGSFCLHGAEPTLAAPELAEIPRKVNGVLSQFKRQRVSAGNRSEIMKNMLLFKGFTARIEFDSEDKIFFGRVLGVHDIISFHGETVSELTADFHHAINHYLDVCQQRGEKPQKTYSGKLTLRVAPEIHADIAIAANQAGKSLNKWVTDSLTQIIHSH